MQETVSFLEMCRICMQLKNYDNKRYKNLSDLLLEDQNLELSVRSALEMLTSTEVSDDDGMPQEICNSCRIRLADAIQLQRQAVEAISTFQQILNDSLFYNKNSKTKEVENYVIRQVDEIIPSSENSGEEFVVTDVEIVPATDVEDDEIEVVIGADDSNQESIIPIIMPETQSSDSNEVEGENAVNFLLEIDNRTARRIQADKQRQTVAKDSVPYAQRRHCCNVCQKKFLRRSNLIDHLRLHTNERLFKCNECGKSFVQSGNYKSHLRIHSKERPYHCHLCPKKYNQSGALKVHIRSHTNERNYKCDVCYKAFTNASDLSKHKRVHDPEKMTKCDYCPKLFAQKSNLRSHVYSYHKKEEEKKAKV